MLLTTKICIRNNTNTKGNLEVVLNVCYYTVKVQYDKIESVQSLGF